MGKYEMETKDRMGESEGGGGWGVLKEFLGGNVLLGP